MEGERGGSGVAGERGSGAGAIVGTGLTAGIATTTGAALLGSAFGVAGAGLAGMQILSIKAPIYSPSNIQLLLVCLR